jgi:hypothetical protein
MAGPGEAQGGAADVGAGQSPLQGGDDAKPAQSPEKSPATPPPTPAQQKTAAQICLVLVSLLAAFVVATLIAAIRQPMPNGPAKAWEAESSHIWQILGWFSENLAEWAVQLAVAGILATLLIAAFAGLHRSGRLISVLAWLLAVTTLATFAAYFMTTQWNEVLGAIAFSMSDTPCPDCKDCTTLTSAAKERLDCAAGLLTNFWSALLVWLVTSLATTLGLKLPGVKRALDKSAEKLGD